MCGVCLSSSHCYVPAKAPETGKDNSLTLDLGWVEEDTEAKHSPTGPTESQRI